MKAGEASKTAEYMALFRALEGTRSRRQRLFVDPLARVFLRPSLRLAADVSRLPFCGDLLRSYIDSRWPGVRTSGAARTLYIDRLLEAALAAGLRQVVVLGAGFDSRAWRLPAGKDVRFFEVDHPDTQARKRGLLRALPAAAGVTFVAVDFGRDSLAEKLAAAGFSLATPSFFLWEGVTNYLSAEAVDATLRYCASAAPGSRVVFTYIHRRALEDPASFYGTERIGASLAAAGEKWTFGLDPATLAAYLAERGLSLLEDVGANDYRAAGYGAEAAAKMRGYEFYRIATAAVPPA